MRDAMRVCAQLEIPFHFLDLEQEYKKNVVDYMINEYKKGRTPNPDIMCNKYIKFGYLFDFAKKNCPISGLLNCEIKLVAVLE